ncbi:hypothetical protein NL53_20630 [Vibrio variabilis]|uniref:Uncharacterized protein n=1 Tax=Vibrio variabilis TaxID=990271 RepID=A0ABR4Y598_9VIBR|nr:hypothetical protein [Vibrio variabilis]KHA58666.1 hypothetical protein NL53_20630 [Vibrio variabilis]
MEINEDNVQTIIDKAWGACRERVEDKDYPLSSEKSLVFLFAMEILKIVGNKLVVDFEQQCYEELSGKSKYLDLLFYTSTNYKVAVEFKLPQGTPDRKETRKSIYRDLARLRYLHDQKSHNYCIFLMASNIESFLNPGNYTNYINYITAHNHVIEPENDLLVENLPLQGVSAKFEWRNIEFRENKTNNNGKFVVSGSYAWIKPIVV